MFPYIVAKINTIQTQSQRNHDLIFFYFFQASLDITLFDFVLAQY